MRNEKLKKKKLYCHAFIFMAGFLIFSGCFSPVQQPVPAAHFGSFREIPGITIEEINAVEAVQKQNRTFVYGMISSTESFYDVYGEISGFSALVCDWLGELFGISFIPKNFTLEELTLGLANHEIDFTGYFMLTEWRRSIYHMTSPIIPRQVKYFRLADSIPLSEIRKTRIPRYLLIADSAATHLVLSNVQYEFEPVYIVNYLDAYDILKRGDADALVTIGNLETGFEVFGDVVTSDFFPLIFSSGSISTQNPELASFISILQKAIDNGAIRHLNELYKQGEKQYLRHKLFLRLTEEERSFIRYNPDVPFAARYDKYPITFFDTRDNEWKGIAFDALRDIEALTGLKFHIVNNQGAEFPELLQLLERGDAKFITELVRTPGREDQFLWPQSAFFTDQMALISRMEHPNTNFHEVMSLTVGLNRGTASADLFHRWFPNHTRIMEFETQSESFEALMAGKVDMVMNSYSSLLHLTNYLELSGFKANILFDYYFDSTFGFNRDAALLCSIIDKALELVDTRRISEQWMRRTFDYRIRLIQAQAEAQRPWVFGVAILILSVILLLLILFVRSRRAKKSLDELVKRRTTELEYQTFTLQTIIDSIPDIIYCRDLNLRLTLYNKAAADYFGITKDELIGKTVEDIPGLPVEVAIATYNASLQLIYEGRVSLEELMIRSHDGRKRLYEATLVPLVQNGLIAGIVGISRDVTERKAMEEEARAASRAKSAFLANMSHEIRTPLNVILGLTELVIEEENLPGSASRNLRKINSAGNTLLGIVNDILDFSKIETGKLTLTPSVYHVPSLINDIVTLMATRLGEKPIVFNLNINGALPGKLFGDDLRVKQIFNNLLSNAVKYTESGNIELTVCCTGEENTEAPVWMEIIVRDTGVGITEENQKNLFTDYYQVENKASRRVEGTGLGLSITKRLVELMDGEIKVESEYGRGSVFRVRIKQGFVDSIPIGDTIAANLRNFVYAEDKQLISKKLLVRPDLSYARVLVVDDMQTNLDVASGLLGKYKMQVDCVIRGADALNRIKLGTPVYDAIFMDHMMPGMDGIETTDAIRALGTDYARKIPIIALTANAIQGTENIFYEHDFQAFISKPVDILQLDSVIRKWIQRKGEQK